MWESYIDDPTPDERARAKQERPTMAAPVIYRVVIQRERTWRERLISRPWQRWSEVAVFEQPFTLSVDALLYRIAVPRSGGHSLLGDFTCNFE